MQSFTLLLLALSALFQVLADPRVIPPLPISGHTTLGPHSGAQTGFIHAHEGGLLTETGQQYTFATFNSPHLLDCTPFEVEDTMRTLLGFARPVSRTYTLSVVSINVDSASAHIQGWDNATGDWIYNEAKFTQFDAMLDLAHKYDVKIVHPIINQDYGDQSSNFAGNWADLIRLRYGLATYEDTMAIDWWRDPVMISSYKHIISHLLNRINTVNGRRYANDPTFLAFETGNEMNEGGTAPPPGAWTVEIAKHIKTLAPQILVLDGSLSRNASTEASWAIEALQAPEVDLHSYHYYRDNPAAYDYRRINTDSAYVRGFGKTYVVGEHGFYANASEFSDFFQRQKESRTAGSMVWSIRPHADNGGFITHGEGDGIFSYHAPGWPPVEADFDPLEMAVIHITRKASFNLLDLRLPAFPIPNSPNLTVVDQNGVTGISWEGGAWAEHYELWASLEGHNTWVLLNQTLQDNVDAGQLFYSLSSIDGMDSYALRGVSVDGAFGPFSNIVAV